MRGEKLWLGVWILRESLPGRPKFLSSKNWVHQNKIILRPWILINNINYYWLAWETFVNYIMQGSDFESPSHFLLKPLVNTMLQSLIKLQFLENFHYIHKMIKLPKIAIFALLLCDNDLRKCLLNNFILASANNNEETSSCITGFYFEDFFRLVIVSHAK